MNTASKVRGRKAADFTDPVKLELAAETGYLCANPSCCAPTFAAGSTKLGVGKVGEAAHISAAAPGAARWLPKMDPAVRKSAANGLWLCDTHAREIDVDENRFPIHLLHKWKRRARARALAARGRPEAWRPSRREELIRLTRWLKLPTSRDEISCFVSNFLSDSGAPAFWDETHHEAVALALYELILNATQHGGADRVYLRSRGYRIDLVHNGTDFHPGGLLLRQGRGGTAAMHHLTKVFGNSLSFKFRHNGAVATAQLIDAGIAGPGHPCAVETSPAGFASVLGSLKGCSTVHVFPHRRLSFSDGPDLEPSIVDLPPTTEIVLHNTSQSVVEYFKTTYPRVSFPGD
ncbi:hypothetical protein JOE40_000687 [Arthrobacter sp. PvP102]|uniref:hypothetical protein n=1 Tax=unclassified Arthrobacter TaxID=235627 RepID=UPI001AEA97D8|nr:MULTISPECIES: hypothetical protein [unclassified Arthrobacter]MBP1235219.1 hypothetical protein [Arthrobacter sp. PvP103]MBP1236178.1 hypothetical protein [Arthrobacter sp. PvP102]